VDQRPSQNDRRRFQRIPKEVAVKANIVTFPFDESACVAAKSRNLSEGGILLRLNAKFDPGTILLVNITLPDWRKDYPGISRTSGSCKAVPFTATCKVVRSRKVGDIFETAVRFLNIEEDDYQALHKYMKRQIRPKKSDANINAKKRESRHA
jgi:c-di-GMP-binding flagellar brake protein YcgR